MGIGQSCFSSGPSVTSGGFSPGAAIFGNSSGIGYGYGSRSVSVPAAVTSQANNSIGYPTTPLISNQIPNTQVPSTNMYVPTYGQNSIMGIHSITQPFSGKIVSPVQPFGTSSANLRPF